MAYFGGVFLFTVAVKLVSSFTNNTSLELNYYEPRCLDSGDFIAEIHLLHTVRETLILMKHVLNIIIRFHNEMNDSIPDGTLKSHYLENLPASFALTRRISNMWPPKLSLMKLTFGRLIKNPQLGFFSNFVKDRETYTKHVASKTGEQTKVFYNSIESGDLWWSAMTGLVRLQETYNLSAADLASGGQPGISGSFNQTSLSARDCFDIGVYCANVNIPVRAVEWLLEASRRAENDAGLSIRLMKEYLFIAYCYMGDAVSHRKILRSLIIDPVFSPTSRLCYEYDDMSSKSCKLLSLQFLQFGYSELHLRPINVRHNALDVANQRGLCRKDTFRYPTDKLLRCRMIHYNQPYLRIGPLKMEELSIEPPVLVFHQVVHESDITDLMEESYNQTKPAIFDYGMAYSKFQDTQLNHFLQKDKTKLDAVWDIKSAIVANALLYRSEPNMLASYGLAGEIRMHLDLGPTDFLFDDEYSRGDYITLMYWLNEPQEGGFTIFPKLDLAVAPKKGSAILWFNRHPNLEVDSRTFHSGCPILSGTKWVLTKWFHVIGQTFPKCVLGKEFTREYYYMDHNIID